MALTRRDILINAVKVKIDELSPFDNINGSGSIDSFIAKGSDDSYDEVNPVTSYIKDTLDKASEYCLNDLPLTLLASDIDFDTERVVVDAKGVGHITIDDKYVRFTRVHVHNHWEKEVDAFITPDSPLYLLQKNKWTRGGFVKPVVAINANTQELELYSFPNVCSGVDADVYYINSKKVAEKVKSAIDDYIALRCAAYVLEILGDAEKAGVLMTEYENKKKGLIQ